MLLANHGTDPFGSTLAWLALLWLAAKLGGEAALLLTTIAGPLGLGRVLRRGAGPQPDA